MSKKKRERPAKEFCIYSIEIIDYEPSYSIAVDHLKEINPDPISESVDLKIIGRVLTPSKVAGKILSLRFLGYRLVQRGLQNPSEVSKNIDMVGELEIRGKKAEYMGFAPLDMMLYLLAGLHSQKLRYIDLFSAPLHYGKAKVTSFHFYGKKDKEMES